MQIRVGLCRSDQVELCRSELSFAAEADEHKRERERHTEEHTNRNKTKQDDNILIVSLEYDTPDYGCNHTHKSMMHKSMMHSTEPQSTSHMHQCSEAKVLAGTC